VFTAIRNGFDRKEGLCTAIAVYTVLTELSSEVGSPTFKVSQREIANKAGVSLRTAHQRLSDLEALGLIQIETPPAPHRDLCTYRLLSVGTLRNHCVGATQVSPQALLAHLGKNLKEQERRSSLAPLAIEPLRGAMETEQPSTAHGSGLNGSRRLQKQFWEGWLPDTEAEFIDLMQEVAEDMENWGGKWRNRWRRHRAKCERVLRTYRDEAKTKLIDHPGGFMDDLWKKRMA
jgi:DNA-binding MarR family transcriptional regulator